MTMEKVQALGCTLLRRQSCRPSPRDSDYRELKSLRILLKIQARENVQ